MSVGFNGRLGNQLFQIASTIGVSRSLGYDVYFPSENFYVDVDSAHSYRGCKVMEAFKFSDKLLIGSETLRSSIKFTFDEGNDFKYNSNIEKIPDNTDLFGYFQNERYFIHCREEILNLFSFREEISNFADAHYPIQGDSVSLHVRRGDYLSSPDHHPTQDISYYKESLDFVGAKNVYVFSDDIKWCETNIRMDGYNWNYVDVENPYISMYMMTQCDNNIICNSSFSWWGAWLNKSENKKVVAPSKWFGPAIKKDPSDVYGKNWKVI